MRIKIVFCFILISNFLKGQSLPTEMYLSEDGKMLLTGKYQSEGFYDSSHIAEVNLQFANFNYWSVLAQNYQSKTELAATMTVDGVDYDGVGVRFKGNTSYTMTGNSQKKSFNVSLDFTHEDLEIDGYSTLNFNNSFQDATFLREVLYARQVKKFIPSVKGNFIHLTLNGVDWGIYPNIQQINKDFYKEWFKNNDGINWRADRSSGIFGGNPGQWGDGTAGLNYLGTDTAIYQTYYTLKYSELADPWSKLVNLCDVLNNTSVEDLPLVLPDYLDVDRTLWFLATEIAFGDDDSYVYKGKMDYYIYYDEQTDLFNTIEFDGNSSFNSQTSSWGPFFNEGKANYPLLNKLLKVPTWRQRYIAHMRTILNESLHPTKTAAIIDNYKTQIDGYVNSDPKKATTYTQFNNGINTLKTWITNRYNNFNNNSEIKAESPVVMNANYTSPSGSWQAPFPNESVWVSVEASHTNGLFQMNLYYDNGLWGNFNAVQMYDDGNHHDGAANDGQFGAEISAQEAGTWVRFYIEAIANNTNKTVSYLPTGAEHDVFIYQVKAQVVNVTGIVINELMASNTVSLTDEDGQYEDWIELFNTTDAPFDISGYYLTDNPSNLDKWQFAENTIIPANGYFIVWADEDSAADPVDHCNFKLSKDGEELILLNTNFEIIDSVVFGPQVSDLSFSRSPNGSGSFIIKEHTFNGNNDGVSSTEDGIGDDIKIYPNPSNNGIYVTGNSDSGHKYEVYNLIGSVVTSGYLSLDQTFIDTKNWASGIYLFKSEGKTLKLNIVH